MRAKTQFYFLIVSLVMSLLGTAIIKYGGSEPKHRTLTPDQQLKQFEKTPNQSPEMRQFLQQEEAVEQAKQEAVDAMPR